MVSAIQLLFEGSGSPSVGDQLENLMLRDLGY
jgi:hypothetical protein